jgi:hypothetical protein
MQHLYGVQSSSNTNFSATNTSLSNELQNSIIAVSVVQTSTSKTAKEFVSGSLHKEFNLF